MTIGILSDTHIPKRALRLPEPVLERFGSVDHIIHAGDISDPSVLRDLERLAPVTAVAGNADGEELRQRLGEEKLLTAGAFKIGIFHGHGTGRTTPKRALRRFRGLEVSCIVFGHSHIPYCRDHEGILLFNPGSPTDKRRQPFYSFGILEFNGASIRPRLIYFDKSGGVIE